MLDSFATYCPEDNKLRLYVGRVPRPEYEALRAEGWTSTPKQDCDFVATWTPRRAATARSYSEGEILDEDQSPEDRAADRAERFSIYRDKRSDEAHGHADAYERQPGAYGYQSQARADRAAARHDRKAGHACDAWSKAEYWQRRTAGVISHALHLSTPAVRMGRILTLESEQRKHREQSAAYAKEYAAWKRFSEITDPDSQTAAARDYSGRQSGASYSYKHPRPELCTEYVREHGTSLWSMLTDEKAPITGAEACALYFARHMDPDSEEWQDSSWMQWERHYELRLAYENQMIEAQGGRANMVEIEAGGFIGSFQIRKVNKSPATGRPVSVQVSAPTRNNFDRQGKAYGPDNPRPMTLHTINIERLAVDTYRPPTPEDKAAMARKKQQEKAATPKPAPCPLVNPTDDDADKLQAALNAHALADHCRRHLKAYGSSYADQFKPSTVLRIPQAVYSANAKGSYARAETRGLCKGAELEPRASNMYSSHEKAEEARRGAPVCQVRTTGSDGSDYGARRVIIITDKPQKALPPEVWTLPPVAILTPAPAAAPEEEEEDEPEPEPAQAPAAAGAVTLAQAHFGF